jgi:ADP-ribose pyrophosphatase YjhB (NUDIX family)
MKELPLAVVISALVKNDKILLIKRIKGDYIGYWGLPGGKIEKNEHVSEAAVREIKEESGIDSDFEQHLGFVSELLIENNNIIQHLLLNVCKLNPKSTLITNNSEGNLKWFDLNKLEKENIIPSDLLMINKMLKTKEKNYYNCVIEKSGNDHILKKFE